MKKKYIIIRLVLLSVLIGVTTESFGQQKATEDSSLPRESTVYSPQVAEMMRYDQTSVNLNLGRIDLTIPLVEWKDKDFDLPISLSYNSEGFRPRNSDNYVGRDWMLNTGGVIYRHVNGVPDDIKDATEPLAAQAGEYYYVNGFLSVLNKRYFNLENMEKEVRDNPYKYTYRRDLLTTLSTLPGVNGKIESSADVFYFSFGKHSGKFMINYDGSVSASGNNGRKYEVDLSGMKMFASRDIQNTYIRIKTDDGYIYTFGGGGYSSLEYTAISWEGNFNSPEGGEKNPRNEITAYHLTEIEAPNGRKLSIVYRDIENQYHKEPWKLADLGVGMHGIGEEKRKEIALQYSLSGKFVRQMYRSAPIDSYLENDAFKPFQKLYALTKIALIDHISTDIATIQFYYSNREKNANYTESDSEGVRFPYHCGAKLDKIEVRTMNHIQTAQLNYIYQLGDRMFLQRIKTGSSGTYAFSYNIYAPVSAPTPMTFNIDHWGFWRGRKQNNGIIPAMRPGRLHEQDYVIISDDRNPTGEEYDYTLLHEVVYPTGGKSVFEYEANRYSRIAVQNFSSLYRIGLGYPDGKQNNVAGGARIYSIKQCDDKGNIIKKSVFTYGNSLSMGEIMYMPFYKYMGTLVKSSTQYNIESLSLDSEGITDLPHPSVHIRYPEVTEHFVTPSAKDLSYPHPYKVTSFKGYINKSRGFYYDDFVFPTYPEGSFPLLRPENYFLGFAYEQYNKNLLAHPTIDASLEYGKIESEKYYNSQKELTRQTDYIYSYKNQDKYALRIYSPTTHFGVLVDLYTHIVREPFFEFSLDKKETRTYVKVGDVKVGDVKAVYCSYDKDGYIAQETSLQSYGDSIIKQYVYNRFSTSKGFQILPATKTVSVGKPGGRLVLSQQQWHYKYQSNSLKDASWYTLSTDNVYDENENLVSEYNILSTDAYGNPIGTVKNGGINTIYLWMCYGQFLAARIENATYDEVRAILGTPPESLSEQDDIASAILLLRDKLPQARVYTYTYKWGVGIGSETSPAGKTVYYDYDIRGRLVQIWRKDKDGKKEILQLNDYHIINE